MLLRLGHILLAFLVLFSTSGLVVNKHYCKSELKSVAFFAQAKSCHESTMPASCPMHGHMSEDSSKKCCNNESEFVKSDYDSVVPTSMDFPQLDFPLVAVATPAFVDLPVIKSSVSVQPYLIFRPPPLMRRLAQLQTYLC